MAIIIDPPTGWAYGFPCAVDEEVFKDEEKLKQFVMSKGYPEKDWKWAKNHIRVWRQ